MSFFKKIGNFVGKIAPAAIGFGLGGPVGGMVGAGLGMMGGSLMGGGSGGSGGGRMNIPSYNAGPNPANAAMPYLNQIAPLGRQYYDPFIGQGQQSSAVANPIYNRMSQDPNAYLNSLGQQQNPVFGDSTQNPTDFLNSIMRNYSPSEGYRFKEKELSRAAQNSAAQGGFAGTRTSQMEQADLVRGLLGDDSQQYLQNVLNIRGLQGNERQQHLQNAFGVQGTGLQGQERNIGRGYESSGAIADYLGNVLGAQAGLQFQGQGQQNQNMLDARNAGMQQQNAFMNNRTARRSSLLNFLGQGLGTAAGLYSGRK